MHKLFSSASLLLEANPHLRPIALPELPSATTRALMQSAQKAKALMSSARVFDNTARSLVKQAQANFAVQTARFRSLSELSPWMGQAFNREEAWQRASQAFLQSVRERGKIAIALQRSSAVKPVEATNAATLQLAAGLTSSGGAAAEKLLLSRPPRLLYWRDGDIVSPEVVAPLLPTEEILPPVGLEPQRYRSPQPDSQIRTALVNLDRFLRRVMHQALADQRTDWWNQLVDADIKREAERRKKYHQEHGEGLVLHPLDYLDAKHNIRIIQDNPTVFAPVFGDVEKAIALIRLLLSYKRGTSAHGRPLPPALTWSKELQEAYEDLGGRLKAWARWRWGGEWYPFS